MNAIWLLVDAPGVCGASEPMTVSRPGDPDFPSAAIERHERILARYDLVPVLIWILEMERGRPLGASSRARTTIELLGQTKDPRVVHALEGLLEEHSGASAADVEATGSLHLQDAAVYQLLQIGDESGVKAAARFCTKTACLTEKRELLSWAETVVNPAMVYRSYWTAEKLDWLLPFLREIEGQAGLSTKLRLRFSSAIQGIERASKSNTEGSPQESDGTTPKGGSDFSRAAAGATGELDGVTEPPRTAAEDASTLAGIWFAIVAATLAIAVLACSRLQRQK